MTTSNNTGTHDDDRKFTLFCDTGWTEHVSVKTCDVMSFVA